VPRVPQINVAGGAKFPGHLLKIILAQQILRLIDKKEKGEELKVCTRFYGLLTPDAKGNTNLIRHCTSINLINNISL
jgi:hypothetical protein